MSLHSAKLVNVSLDYDQKWAFRFSPSERLNCYCYSTKAAGVTLFVLFCHLFVPSVSRITRKCVNGRRPDMVFMGKG